MTTKCLGNYKNGMPCKYRAKFRGMYCGYHVRPPVECRISTDIDIDTDTDEMCPICHDAIKAEDRVSLGCQHDYHRRCITAWLSRKESCPMCRQDVSSAILQDLNICEKETPSMLGRSYRIVQAAVSHYIRS